MNHMTHYDDRLPNNTYVWGVNIGEDAVCYTDDFIGENNGLINATIGGGISLLHMTQNMRASGSGIIIAVSR